jgi:hypothetical protein
MARRTVSKSFYALDEERVALRIKIAMLKEQGGNYAEIEDGSERLAVLNEQIRKMINR